MKPSISAVTQPKTHLNRTVSHAMTATRMALNVHLSSNLIFVVKLAFSEKIKSYGFEICPRYNYMAQCGTHAKDRGLPGIQLQDDANWASY